MENLTTNNAKQLQNLRLLVRLIFKSYINKKKQSTF